MSDFPTLSTGQDSRYYTMQQEDTSLKTTMEGGYVVARAKHTRKPRRTFTSGFTDISDADKQLLEDFFDTVNCAAIFTWVDPQSGMGGAPPVAYQVRFDGPLSYQYKGMGPTKRWDVTFTVVQA